MAESLPPPTTTTDIYLAALVKEIQGLRKDLKAATKPGPSSK